MLKLKSIIVLLFASSIIVAQESKPYKTLENVNVYFSKKMDRKAGSKLTEFVGEVNGELVTYTNSRGADYFTRYNAALRPIKTISVEHATYSKNKKVGFTHFGFVFNKGQTNCFRLVGLTDKKAKSNKLFLVAFDLERMQMGEWKEIASIDGDGFFSSFSNSFAGRTYSPDTSHIAIAYKLPATEASRSRIGVVVVDGNNPMKEIWKKDFSIDQKGVARTHIPGKGGGYNPTSGASFLLSYSAITNGMAIDESGYVYSWVYVDNGRGKDHRFSLFALTMSAEELETAEVRIDKKSLELHHFFHFLPTRKGARMIGEFKIPTVGVTWNNGSDLSVKELDLKNIGDDDIRPLPSGDCIVQHGISSIALLDQDMNIVWDLSIGISQYFGKFIEQGMSGIKTYVYGDKCYTMINDNAKNMGPLWNEKQVLEHFRPMIDKRLAGAVASFSISDPSLDGLREKMWTGEKPAGYYTPRALNFNAQFGNHHYTYILGSKKTETIIKVEFK